MPDLTCGFTAFLLLNWFLFPFIASLLRAIQIFAPLIILSQELYKALKLIYLRFARARAY